jgi:hypothetical protein
MQYDMGAKKTALTRSGSSEVSSFAAIFGRPIHGSVGLQTQPTAGPGTLSHRLCALTNFVRRRTQPVN